MPDDRYTWDLDTPHPNVEIDTLRRVTKNAIEDLTAAVTDVRSAQDGVDDAYWLSDLLFSLLDSALAGLAAATTERQQLRADIDSLTARLDSLSPPDLEVP